MGILYLLWTRMLIFTLWEEYELWSHFYSKSKLGICTCKVYSGETCALMWSLIWNFSSLYCKLSKPSLIIFTNFFSFITGIASLMIWHRLRKWKKITISKALKLHKGTPLHVFISTSDIGSLQESTTLRDMELIKSTTIYKYTHTHTHYIYIYIYI